MLENNNLFYIAQNHLSVKTLKHFVYRWQMNITVEFYFPSMIHSRDIKLHNINIDKSITVEKIIHA